MKNIIAIVVAIGLPITAISEEGRKQGAEYLNWCSHLADAEQLLGPQREGYIRLCMESLAEADQNYDAEKRKDPPENEEEE